jgi:hypothetical protein
VGAAHPEDVGDLLAATRRYVSIDINEFIV